MATEQSIVDFILEQIKNAGTVYAKKMFGEYGLYCNGKMVALICDDQLFVKPTEDGKAYLGQLVEGHPYPGSKPWFLISGDKWDDSEWLTKLVNISAEALPLPKSKSTNKKIKKHL